MLLMPARLNRFLGEQRGCRLLMSGTAPVVRPSTAAPSTPLGAVPTVSGTDRLAQTGRRTISATVAAAPIGGDHVVSLEIWGIVHASLQDEPSPAWAGSEWAVAS